MPLLFPIAALNLVNMAVCERIFVAKLVKLPPMMDDKLTKNAIDALKFAPLMMITNGYWMLSNN